MRVRRLTCIVNVLLATLALKSDTVSAQSDREAVLKTVNQLFAAMAQRDTVSLRSVLTPEGRFAILRVEGDRTVLSGASHAEFITRIATATQELVERMWDPQVLTDGNIATVWAPYDFYQGGSFSHCGTDVFTLVRTEQGWKISGASYTVVRTGCAPSPLGPPKR